MFILLSHGEDGDAHADPARVAARGAQEQQRRDHVPHAETRACGGEGRLVYHWNFFIARDREFLSLLYTKKNLAPLKWNRCASRIIMI